MQNSAHSSFIEMNNSKVSARLDAKGEPMAPGQ